jgi:hypothetical protein
MSQYKRQFPKISYESRFIKVSFCYVSRIYLLIYLFYLTSLYVEWKKYLSTGVNILCSAQRFRKTSVRFLWPFTTWVLQPKKTIRVYSSERQNRQTVTTTKPLALCVYTLLCLIPRSFSISVYCLVQTCRHPWTFDKHNKGQQTVFLLLFLPIATRDSIL